MTGIGRSSGDYPQSYVGLEVNRLSGALHVKSGTIIDINVLNGNVFSCDHIPKWDEHIEGYTCGSEALNYSLNVLLGAIAVFLAFICLCGMGYMIPLFKMPVINEVRRLLCCTSAFSKAIMDHPRAESDIMRVIKEIVKEFHDLPYVVIVMTSVSIVLCVPIYAYKILDEGSEEPFVSTHSHTYTWKASLAYTSGSFAFLSGTLHHLFIFLM